MGTRLIIWQKPNGDTIERKVSYNDYRIGDSNSYRWKVIDIQYWNGKKFCNEKEYDKYIRLNSTKEKLYFSIRDYITKANKQFINLISLAIFLKVVSLTNMFVNF